MKTDSATQKIRKGFRRLNKRRERKREKECLYHESNSLSSDISRKFTRVLHQIASGSVKRQHKYAGSSSEGVHHETVAIVPPMASDRDRYVTRDDEIPRLIPTQVHTASYSRDEDEYSDVEGEFHVEEEEEEEEEVVLEDEVEEDVKEDEEEEEEVVKGKYTSKNKKCDTDTEYFTPLSGDDHLSSDQAKQTLEIDDHTRKRLTNNDSSRMHAIHNLGFDPLPRLSMESRIGWFLISCDIYM